MSYLIIFLVICLALAPVFALKPSKRQKHQMALRDRSRALGMQIQLCEMPQTRRQQVRREDTIQGVAYRLLWRHDDAKGKQFHYLLHRDETEPNKAPLTILQSLQQALGEMPPSVMAVDFAPHGVAAYWLEEGDLDSVEMIAVALTGLKQRLSLLSLPKPSTVESSE